MKSLGLVIPTRWEAGPVLRAFRFRRVGRTLFQATINNRPVWLILSGAGRERARQAGFRLCDLGAGELVSAGFCGALTPEARVGDLVTERLASVPRPISTVAERQALAQKAGAQAVDMETQAIVEAGTRRGVPVRILRVVSDRFEDDLSPLFGSDKNFSSFRIALRLLNPRLWPLAARLRRQSVAARARLVEALRSFFSHA